MLVRMIRRLAGISKLLLAIAVFRADVATSLRDVRVQAAWQRFTTDPAVAAVLPRLTAEWRTVEEAFNRLM